MMTDRLPDLLDVAAAVTSKVSRIREAARPFPCPRKHLLRTPCLPRPLPLKSRPGRGARGEGG